MADLPDYHQYVSNVKVEIPEGEEPESWIAEYDSSPEDLPDGSTGPLLCDVKGRLYVVSEGLEVTLTGQDIIPRPKGGSEDTGSGTTAAAYAEACAITPVDGKTLQLCKIVVAVKADTWVKLVWAAVDTGYEIIVPGGSTFTDWFPWDWRTMAGDGSKKLSLQVKYDASADSFKAEIVGEEV